MVLVAIVADFYRRVWLLLLRFEGDSFVKMNVIILSSSSFFSLEIILMCAQLDLCCDPDV